MIHVTYIHTVGTAMSANSKYFSGKPQMKGPSGTSTRRWENNIKTEVKETGCQRDWVYSTGYGQVKMEDFCGQHINCWFS
jgi:hypothetical protein